MHVASTAIVLILLCGFWRSQCFEIVDSYTTLEIINGHARHKHLVRVEVDDADAGQTFEFTLTDASGKTRVVKFTPEAPQYIYTHQHTGWVPRFIQDVSSKVCLDRFATNTSMLFRDRDYGTIRTSPLPGGKFENYSIFNGLGGGTGGGARRRLLSVEEEDLRPDQSSMYDDPDILPHNVDVAEMGHHLLHETKHAPAARRLLTNWVQRQPNWAQQLMLAAASYLAAKPLFKYNLYRRRDRLLERRRTARQKLSNQKKPSEAPNVKNEASIEAGAEERALAQGAENAAIKDAEASSAIDTAGAVEADAIAADALESSAGGPDMLAFAVASIGVSMAANKIFHIGGGGGGVADALKAFMKVAEGEWARLDGRIDHLQTLINGLEDFEAQTLVNEVKQKQIDDHLQDQIDDNVKTINNVKVAVTRIQGALDVFEQHTMSDFNSIEGQIETSINETDILWNITRDMYTHTQTQLTRLISAVSKLALSGSFTQAELSRMHRDVSMRRGLINMFHRLDMMPTAQPTKAFLRWPGIYPLGQDAIAELQTEAGAARIGSVYLQRTVEASGGGAHYAQFYNLTLACDPLHLVDETFDVISFKDMFGMLGPTGCYAGGDPTSVWNCTCVIKVEMTQCELSTDSGAKDFPWEWSEPRGLPNEGSEWCNEPPETPDEINLIGDSNTSATFDNISDVEAWITRFCEFADTVPYTYGMAAPNGSKVRVYSEFWPRYANMALNGTNDCLSNFAIMQDGEYDDTQNWLAYMIYYMFTKNYQLHTAVNVPFLEDHIYGKMPSGLNFQEQPFNTDNEQWQTYRCVVMSFLKIADQTDIASQCFTNAEDPGYECPKARVYRADYNGMRRQLKVEVDGVEITNRTAPLGSVQAVSPFSATKVGNSTYEDYTTVTTNILLDDTVRLLLENTLWHIDPPSGNLMPDGSYRTYDVPMDMFKGGVAPSSRFGGITYLFQSKEFTTDTETTPINFTRWETFNGAPFDARGQGGSPHNFARRLARVTFDDPTDVICAEAYTADGETIGNSTGDLHWCQILNYYKVSVENGGTLDEVIIFEPKYYSYSAELQVPGGTFVETHYSYCPSDVKIVNINGDAYVTFNTTFPEGITVDALVTNLYRNCTDFAQAITIVEGTGYTLPVIRADPACGPWYVNVKSIDTGEYCYNHTLEPGIALSTSIEIIGTNQGGAMGVNVLKVQDTLAQDIAKSYSDAIDIAEELRDIDQNSIDTDDVNTRMAALRQKQEQSIKGVKSRTAMGQEQMAKLEGQADEQLSKAGARIISDRSKEDANQKLINQLGKENAGKAILEAHNKALNEASNKQGAQADEQTKKAIDNAKHIADHIDNDNSLCGGGGDSGFFGEIFGTIMAPICALEKFFKGAIGSIFSFLLHILLIGAIVYGLFLAFSCCVEGGCKCFSGRGSQTVKIKGTGSRFTVKRPATVQARPGYAYHMTARNADEDSDSDSD